MRFRTSTLIGKSQSLDCTLYSQRLFPNQKSPARLSGGFLCSDQVFRQSVALGPETSCFVSAYAFTLSLRRRRIVTPMPRLASSARSTSGKPPELSSGESAQPPSAASL